MKKLSLSLIIALCLTLFAFAGKFTWSSAYAEELSSEAVESATTGESSTDEEIPAEEPTDSSIEDSALNSSGKPNITLTEDELNDIINSVLTEQQKSLIATLSDKLSSVFNVDAKIIYLITASSLVILLIIIVLASKVAKAKGSLKAVNSQLTAQHSAYAVLAQTKEDLQETLKNLSAEEIAKRVEHAYDKQAEELVERVSHNVVRKLKIDDKTLAELLGNEKTIVAQEKAIKEALLAIASNNRDLAVSILSKAPTVEQVSALSLENEKLKVALGEEAVAKILNTPTQEE